MKTQYTKLCLADQKDIFVFVCICKISVLFFKYLIDGFHVK